MAFANGVGDQCMENLDLPFRDVMEVLTTISSCGRNRLTPYQSDVSEPENSSVIPEHVADEGALVAAAAAGDHEAFRRLVEPIGRELHRFCYRMLGSFHDAEDVLQEAQVKAWRGLERFDRRATFRTWMYRIVTNATLDAVRSRRRRVLPQDLGVARDPTLSLGDQRHDIAWLEPYPDALLASSDPDADAEARESVRLAFVRALQILPARQRAVLILRDVLDWSAVEVAAALDTSVAAINGALQRARATVADRNVADRYVERSEAAERDGLDARKAEMAVRYVTAWEAGDIDAIVSMLTEDAIHAMPPWAAWFVGPEALRTVYSSYGIWGDRPGPGLFRILPAALNGELGFAEYCRDAPNGPYRALALTVTTLNPAGTHIAEKVSFVRPDLFASMGFPEVLE
jgi:RNA polymerase sigma-70 factor (ECF subfamily)